MYDFAYQLYSSRNFGPLPQTLAMLAEAGYRWVEAYGALIETADDTDLLARALEETGLTMTSAHVDLTLIEEDPGAVVKRAKRLGLSHIYVPYLAEADRPTRGADWAALGQRVARAGEPLRAAGLHLGWHNHDFECTALADGSLPLDHLLGGDPALQLEFDLAWAVRAGQDPQALISRYGPRISAVHVKDIAQTNENIDEEGWADVGHGTLPWGDLYTALRATPCRHFIVEHDNPSDDRRFARRSLDFLRHL